MKINKKLILPCNLKIVISIFLTILFFNCSNDNDNSTNTSKTKLLAIDGVGSRLRIVELDPKNGNLISEFLKFEVLQASIDFDFSYFKSSNELFIKRNVYENGIGPQIIKINIDTKEQNIISTEINSKIIIANDKLFGFNRTVDNELLTIDLVEINPENGFTIKQIEKFETLENAPQNDKTGVTNIFYSFDTNEIIIPRRVQFITGATDQLIKINASTGKKTTVPIKHYESITVGRNGRIFAINRNSSQSLTRSIIEIDINSGKELEVLKDFDPPTFQNLNISFLSSNNELLIDMGLELKKINIDTKETLNISNQEGYYSFRSINIY